VTRYAWAIAGWGIFALVAMAAPAGSAASTRATTTAATREAKDAFDGLWLTDLGLMELSHAGDASLRGRYALAGVSTISGTASGRRFEFKYKSFGSGTGWFELSADGGSFAGEGIGKG